MNKKEIFLKDIYSIPSLIKDFFADEEYASHRFSLGNVQKQVEFKEKSYSKEQRKILCEVLEKQLGNLQLSDKQKENLQSLSQENTFTSVTGHQLNLFTGPAFFVYKILQTIKTTDFLNQNIQGKKFVPIFWMATEDHDFEEINHFHLNNRTICWNSEQTGATGNFATDTLDAVFQTFDKAIGLGKNAEELKALFRDSYLKHHNLAEATRYLVNALFEEYGIVVIDGNDKDLKQLFIPYIKEDLFNHTAQKEVEKTIADLQALDAAYPIQVNPREINMFYLTEGGRNRIVRTSDDFEVLNTDIKFTETSILEELNSYPERFSPNVILRPLYQEVILPNLAYIGGGGEIAYWLELKRFFNKQKVPFPMLMLRNSAMLVSKRQYERIEKLKLHPVDLFLKPEDVKNLKVQQLSEFPIDFSAQKAVLLQQFADLHLLAKKTDITFENAVKAQEVRQLKGLDKLEKRLLKAQKRKFSEELERVIHLQSELFPNGILQERFSNFSDFYLLKGKTLISELVSDFNPFDYRFVIVVID